MYEWDEKKAAANFAKHGVPFEAIEDFDWRYAAQVEDGRFDYGEDLYWPSAGCGASFTP